jgi:hypothetical protein
MRLETKSKLSKLANIVVVKYGKEIIDFDNYLTILKKESDSNGINLHFNTIKLHLNWITIIIRNTKNDFLELDSNKVEDEVKPLRKLVKAKFMYSDGSVEILVIEGGIGEVPNEPVQPELERQFTGLFNYKNDKSIIIRRGTYAGCDITSKSSIIQKFKGLSWYETWCRGRINDVKTGKIAIMPDTPRDMETLEKVIKQIEIIKNDKLF